MTSLGYGGMWRFVTKRLFWNKGLTDVAQTRTVHTASSNFRSDPGADLIEEHIQGSRRFFILENVVKSGLLDDLEKEAAPISVASFCGKYNYHDDVTESTLNLLAAMGFVTKTKMNDEWKYFNSTAASKYLTKSSPINLNHLFFAERKFVENRLARLPLALKQGRLSSTAELYDGPETGIMIKENAADGPTSKKVEMADQTSEFSFQDFSKLMECVINPAQHVIPRLFDLSSHRKAVDLGGGSGFLATLFIDHYPQLSIQVFDLPQMLNEVKEQFENYSTRMGFLEGDFCKEDLPPADLYILSHVLHTLSETEIDLLLDKIFKSLPPGGELLILEKILNEDKDGPTLALSLNVLMAMLGEGRERTSSEYMHLLKKHGFVNTRTHFIQGTNYFDAMLTTKPT